MHGGDWIGKGDTSCGCESHASKVTVHHLISDKLIRGIRIREKEEFLIVILYASKNYLS